MEGTGPNVTSCKQAGHRQQRSGCKLCLAVRVVMVEIAIEGFLCQFVPLLYMFPAHEFDAACSPSAGIQDDELEHEALNNSRRSFEPLRLAYAASG
ncbi:hypothetical protein L210DRAFT_3548809 [Boletus edulis BED1]|uniref:Uncharacterized protein n=1 Tax=Boletus edulis BED1 TaxID=1328754 RepID=A0AAD4BQ32_BOLED|nr:hypothetical protein L210DRAFT_3548809 [Boletus edulis BED1]